MRPLVAGTSQKSRGWLLALAGILTTFFAEYRDQNRELRYINCGHPAALLVRAGGAVERLEATALPLGIFGRWTCEEKSVSLRPGDVVLVFSDGVVEAGVDNGEEFGEGRLLETLRSAPAGGGVEALLDHVVAAVLRFSPGGQSDDVTMVALKVR